MTNVSQNTTTGNQIQVFNFTQNEVRTAKDENGEPLFCLTDVAKILDIQNPNPSRFNFKKDGVHKMYTLTNGGNQEVTFIDVRNLYRVIFRSNKPEAVKFQDWIYDEVIPAIRKTGSYSTRTNKTALESLEMVTHDICYNLGMNQHEWQKGICATMGVEKIEDLTSEQIAEIIAHSLTLVVGEIIQDKPLIELDQLTTGGITDYNLRSTIESVIRPLSKLI